MIDYEPPPILPRLGVRVEIGVIARGDTYAGEVVRIPRGPWGWAVVARTDDGRLVWMTQRDAEARRKVMRIV